ncbi:Cobalamin synthesis CobW domain protein OS=Tsukamurella paurometabola (strain ATCC 8368 / DSM/ CCUG 35730 / CIP 100753 / JCM 10117 / KCTC 9821 / NBRC 16120/ NCIMB 702349 / NCTC 13040) OX=521096 GN=Tpau_3290 PE=4 SV=1 [Tsukamurella paurometabola]|uniref:Cobalamin synthesis CobW domain protein n=1 Tax=Tsukamurella paurometabola (strain ATCC 8368 / DSM 20162 / CCUG 35730 / CIP 100753 / JCM 10117 / KCTC 9821 / NBRC 16120 / NCIMB 702349 / NCTC 13040) TaxID=521096 RepID=D5UVU3_TSUPD|nr:GTP-binding protein [Tsukamurella paurometabola]ADG79875.1 cobalamin synthesis CobW domain protein [Tsukamurella paurometabola DSM 20162]SUP37496.1 Cobalamin synthesis protein cobW C-terminal domain [Tsukamurella paurometabola]
MGIISNRTPVLLVTGFGGQERALELAEPGTVVVHHDLSGLRQGMVVRSESTVRPDGVAEERVALLELAHGCVSCTLREDLLPLLRALHRRAGVRRIVIRLDPTLEAEALIDAIEHVVVEMVGEVPGPAARDVEVAGVIGFLDGATWLDDALGEEDLVERFAVVDGDERTVAQLAVGHAAHADLLVVDGDSPDPARLRAVLRRLAPGAPIVRERAPLDRLVARIGARRPAAGPFDPLLLGCPPLEPDGDVRIVEFTARRPLHPGRFHEAIDVLLDGVVQARGRVWLATRPDEALWLESAGSGLRVGPAGRWLAAGGEGTPERWAMASAAWDDEHGDRASDIVVLLAGAEPDRVLEMLRWAELTESELAAGSTVWAAWPDPFGDLHADPCEDLAPGTRPEADQEEMQ